MKRFGNLKAGSVFGILHPETAVSISGFGFQKKKKKFDLKNLIFFSN